MTQLLLVRAEHLAAGSRWSRCARASRPGSASTKIPARAADARGRGAEVSTKDPWLRESRPIVIWPGGKFASGWIDPNQPVMDGFVRR